MVTVGTQQRNDEIAELSKNSAIWIGLNDRAKEGTWLWSDGTHIDEDKFTYTNWNGNEPNNQGDEDCIEQLTNFKWNDKKCKSTTRSFVCEIVCMGPNIHNSKFTLSFVKSYN